MEATIEAYNVSKSEVSKDIKYVGIKIEISNGAMYWGKAIFKGKEPKGEIIQDWLSFSLVDFLNTLSEDNSKVIVEAVKSNASKIISKKEPTSTKVTFCLKPRHSEVH